MTGRHIRLLLIEDSADDAEMIDRALQRGGYSLELSRVDSEKALRAALERQEYDLAITDQVIPGFNSAGVLEILAEEAPSLPCLLVSGKVGEEAVSAVMRQGAVDYVAKDNLERLSAAVERTLVESDRRRERDAAEEALARSGRLFEAVFATALEAMLIVDDDRRLVDANPAAAELFAMPRSELVSLRIDHLMPDTSPLDASQVWDNILSAEGGCDEVDLLRADGALVATEYTVAPNFLPGRHIMVMRDISERRLAEAQAERHIAQQEAIVSFGERALREDDLDLLHKAAVAQIASTLNAEFASVLELSAGERAFVIKAMTATDPPPVEDRFADGPETTSQASYTVHEVEPVLVEDYDEESRFERDPIFTERGVRSALSVEIPGVLHPFGVLCAAATSPRAFRADDANFLTAIANILADALKRARSEDEIRALGLHDALTGLPNRTLFFDRLNIALARTDRLDTRVAVFFLDIDDFKSFNDTLGHRATDRLLAQVGARIERTMRQTDTVARFGGDEFVILCEDLAGEVETEALITRLVSSLAAPFCFDEERQAVRAEVSASIGVALSDAENNLDAEALLRDADAAMYRSKHIGRGIWTLATEGMRDSAIERSRTKLALEKAIETDELLLHYQPIVALDGGAILGVEALVRWEHPERGLIPPGEFIPLAEESGLILRLGEWVLRTACRQAAAWRADLHEGAPLPIHVNLSATQVAQPDLPERVCGVLEETGVPPGDIVLEITESALIQGVRGPIVALEELTRLGVIVMLDDFGTGYSSLSYLDCFPIDTLKIDRAFVSKLEDAASPAPIVTAIVGMARALSVGTIAEGVETAEQAAGLGALGCERVQGYFFARPGPAEQITELVNDDAPLRERAAEVSALGCPRTALLWAGLHAGPEQLRTPASVPEYRQWLLAALLAPDLQAAKEVIVSAATDGIGADTIDTQIIGAAWAEVARLRERGELSEAEEQLAAGIADQLRGSRPLTSARRIAQPPH